MSDTIYCPECGQLKSECICGRINGGDKMENEIKQDVVKEEPVILLTGVFTIAHCEDDKVPIYWSDLKSAEQGDTWEAAGNSSVMKATVLYKDTEGCFVRVVWEDHNDYTDYPDEVSVTYYDFGR